MFDQLKPILQNGERVVVVEDGRPEYVLLRYADYVSLLAGRRSNPGHGPVRGGDWERANAEFEGARAAARMPDLPDRQAGGQADVEPEAVEIPSADPTTVRLEDLPL
ncbi:MAG: hypothetical protein A3B37_03095 [Candidatus Sungbacteria bacterium RIFCSPLOWO2_01_FULL_59_16]|uniref:Antitoxin n=1 Tax=Candidatus Sungbacteria bacterium RIFCSPLOWO2_01_FULL_59_16 TaxID=1802280 RepID=A0A1G2LBI8_9BACT|nr:MAG: hypothetical protein A3B37_03095 [Candidatus Sungbacteria bacterium RIFCSPLOWO2_01_FULL_59_16]